MNADELHVYAYPKAVFNEPFFPPGVRLVFDSPKPDLVVVRTGHQHPGRIRWQIAEARWRFGWRPLVYANYGEAVPVGANRRNVDCLFSFAPTDGHNWQHERYQRNPLYVGHAAARAECRSDSLWGLPKTRFCNFVYRNAHGQQTHVRNGFARRLMQVRRVDCPGAVFNNCAPLPPYGAPGKAGVVAKLRFLAGYRFTIAFENTSADYYVSEKILHPLLAGSIPIYWGCPQVAKYYNPRALINCHDFASFDDVIAHVLAVDADPALQDAYRRAPMLRPDSRIHRLHRDLDTRHRAIVREALARRRLPDRPGRDRLRSAAFALRSLPFFVWGLGHDLYRRARRYAGALLHHADLC